MNNQSEATVIFLTVHVEKVFAKLQKFDVVVSEVVVSEVVNDFGLL